jgi:hypothetical protein
VRLNTTGLPRVVALFLDWAPGDALNRNEPEEDCQWGQSGILLAAILLASPMTVSPR